MEGQEQGRSLGQGTLVRGLLLGCEDLATSARGPPSPYCKVLQGGRCLHRSTEKRRTVHPMWNEQLVIQIENSFIPLVFEVYDKNLFEVDTLIGQAEVNIGGLELGKTCELTLHLENSETDGEITNKGLKESLGKLIVRLTVSAGTTEELAKFAPPRKEDMTGIVHVLILEITTLGRDPSDPPYCKARLGKEKQKTRPLAPGSWETMEFRWFHHVASFLDLTLLLPDPAKGDVRLGRVDVDLQELEVEVAHDLWLPVGEDGRRLHLVVTVTATRPSSGERPCWREDLASLVASYGAWSSLANLADIGTVAVRLVMAKGLQARDLTGTKANPWAVARLGNVRLMTHTVQKSLDPLWQKEFRFPVQDIHEALEVTVYDATKEARYCFLGQVVVPLLGLQQGGRRWFKLKDRHLRGRAGGEDPQVLLEVCLHWNLVRAALRTFQPPPVKYEQKAENKFKFVTFNKNLTRIKKAATPGFDLQDVIKKLEGIINWEDKFHSSIVLILYVLLVWFFEPWMLPACILIPFIYNFILQNFTNGLKEKNGFVATDNEDDEEADNEQITEIVAKKNENKSPSLKKKLKTVEDICLIIQEYIGCMAQVLESINNLFNFSVPFLSWLAITVILLITMLLALLPLRLVLLHLHTVLLLLLFLQFL